MDLADWHDLAACAEIGTDPFFPEKGEPTAPAKRVCMSCEVRAECLAGAMQAERGMGRYSRHGIWGGQSPHQRWKAERDERRARREAA